MHHFNIKQHLYTIHKTLMQKVNATYSPKWNVPYNKS